MNFDFTTIDFGCVLNDTTKTMIMRVTNNSAVDTAFAWAFSEDEAAARAAAGRLSTTSVADLEVRCGV